MGKLGAMQDLVRGIRKLVPREAPASAAAPVHTAEIAPMLRRAYMCLGDADYDKAAEILDDVLNRDPENVRAYVGLLMAELHVRREEDLTSAPKELTNTAISGMLTALRMRITGKSCIPITSR